MQAKLTAQDLLRAWLSWETLDLKHVFGQCSSPFVWIWRKKEATHLLELSRVDFGNEVLLVVIVSIPHERQIALQLQKVLHPIEPCTLLSFFENPRFPVGACCWSKLSQIICAYICRTESEVGHQAGIHEILDASTSAPTTVTVKMPPETRSAFSKKHVTWQDPLGSSAYRWCGSENAA